MIVDKILEGVTKEEEGRQRGNPIRMSSAGKCQRAIAYQLYEFKAEPMSGRALMVFRLGDTVEAEIKSLINKYCHDLKVEYPKDDFKIEIDGHEVTGHIDGLITHPDSQILEVKSTNGNKFKMLEKTGIPYDYKCQTTCYMRALGLKKTTFIFYNKDTSHILEIPYHFEEEIWGQVQIRFSNIFKSTKEKLPEREYGPDAKGKLPWQCSYCSYNKHCWPDAVVVFERNKPNLYRKGTL